jgi:hypothetical protein
VLDAVVFSEVSRNGAADARPAKTAEKKMSAGKHGRAFACDLLVARPPSESY